MPLNDEYYHDGGDSTALQVERDDLIELIMEVLEEFSQKDQMVVQLYYFEELNLKEISQILSITESRVSQIHKSVISKIKQRVGV
jgi:RNA polymerase sigma factor for flagellar operon FliA